MSANPLPRPAVRPATPLDVERLRADFPILANVRPHGKPLAYLDNGASSQMPQQVIDRMVRYRQFEHANIHRGVHTLSQVATEAYEEARRKVQRYLNAAEEREVIFTSQRDRRDQPGHAGLWAQVHRRRRRDRPHAPGAPREHRAVADAVRGEGRPAARRADQRRGRGHRRGVPEALQPAHEVRVDHARLERARYGQPGEGHDRHRARPRRAGPGRRRAGRAAPEGRRARSGLPTSTASPATSSSARPASARSTARRGCSRRCNPTRAAGT